MPRGIPRHMDPRFAGDAPPADVGAVTVDEPLPGIGESEPQGDQAAALELLAEHPALGKLIGGLVQRQVAAALSQAGVAAPTEEVWGDRMVRQLETLTLMHAEQRPGYQKPLPAEEKAWRDAGWREMNELLAHYREQGICPRYQLVQEPLFAGEIEYRPGSVIESYLIPNEYMAPQNEAAVRIHRAMMQWIGGPQVSIGERLAQAQEERHSGINPLDPTPFKKAGLPDASPVAVVAEPPQERGFDPRRPPQAAHELADLGTVHRI